MADTSKEQKAREEGLMARGPVSRGAENQDALMNRDRQNVRSTQRPPDTSPNPNRREGSEPEHSNQPNQPEYNKMNMDRTSGTREGSGMETDRDVGNVGGGTLPDPGRGTDRPRGGMNTSNSTVAGGGISAGGLAGAGSTRDRGSMPDLGTDTSTNNADELERMGQSPIGGHLPGQPVRPAPRGARRRSESQSENKTTSD
jgi:hypothetical protein